MNKSQKKYLKENNGITLIALVVTIIILIILAGISINLVLGENGIIQKANQASKEYEETQLQEELELEIASIMANKIKQGKDMTKSDLQELSNIGAIIKTTETLVIGEYKGYDFTVDEKYSVTMRGKVTDIKPEVTFTKDTEEIVEEITITVKATTEEGKIISVIKPDGTKTTETEFEYKVKENKIYTFIVEGSNGKLTVANIEITNVKETAADPIIESKYGYPVIKTTSIENDGTTTITYDTKKGLENYYSIDGGTTWNLYTGPFVMTNTGTIMAKSTKNGNILSEASKSITKPSDSLPISSVNQETGEISWTYAGTVLVDSSAWGSRMYLQNTGRILMTCIDSQGTSIGVYSDCTYSGGSCGSSNRIKWPFIIPEGTHKIKIETHRHGNANYVGTIKVTDIKEPIIESKYGYPIIKSTGIEMDGTTTITYDNKEGLENYYSIDGGTTWNLYTGPFIIDGTGTIMAKSMRNGEGVEISKNITIPSDALPISSTNQETGEISWTFAGIALVDSSAWGCKIDLGSKGRIVMTCMDSEGNSIDVYSDCTGLTSCRDNINLTWPFVIPESTHKIKIETHRHGNANYVGVINISN